MAYSLADDLYYADVDGRFIFLDLTADRYFALPAPLNLAFQHMLAGANIANASLIEGLMGTGVLTASVVARWPRASSIAVATHALPDRGQFNLGDVVRALACQYFTMWQMRRLDLARVLAWASKADNAASRKGADVMRIAHAFAQSDALLSLHDKCLMKSIALLRALRSNGHEAELVIAVQARPFVAHCWVQWNGTVLNDDPDHVRTFVPIVCIR
jgi:hypothetical protein